VAKLIVYACPVGELGRQIQTYLAVSATRYGHNKAHGYPPHCTLVSFFCDELDVVPSYIEALDAALTRGNAMRPSPAISVLKHAEGSVWLYLAINSPWLIKTIRDFAADTPSYGCRSKIRPKTELHVTLARGDLRATQRALIDLARTEIDPSAPVSWEIRLYEQRGESWICHHCWQI
jgi:hypothetical protein